MSISFLTAQQMARSTPNRILINAEGEAVTMKRVLEIGVVADLIFVRNDGWSLGAPNYLEKEAHDLWKSDWILVHHVASNTDLAYPFYLARSEAEET